MWAVDQKLKINLVWPKVNVYRLYYRLPEKTVSQELGSIHACVVYSAGNLYLSTDEAEGSNDYPSHYNL